MCEETVMGPGSIGWLDLTVGNAPEVKEFYQGVASWVTEEVEMEGYSDYAMGPPGTDAIVGVCHAEGANAEHPPQWLIYIFVEDLDASMDACGNLGGEVIAGPREMEGHGKFCIVRDPAGAAAALFQPEEN